MKCREVSFYIEPQLLEVLLDGVLVKVLPQFLQLPHFRGYVALETDHGSRRKVIVLSFWDNDLEESDAASLAFVEAVYEVTNTNPARETFNFLGAMLIETD